LRIEIGTPVPHRDRRKAYEKKMREAGNVKVTLWVAKEVAPELKRRAKESRKPLS
jgi:hypothetical protein